MNSSNQSFRDLTVYKKAFEMAMEIFEISKTFLKEEGYSLTDQIRRSSEEVGKMLNHMIENPEKYLRQKEKIMAA